jgi:thiamine monophosphate synthase
MEGKKDAKDAEEKEALSEHMDYICAGNVFVKKLKKWDLKNTLRRLRFIC